MTNPEVRSSGRFGNAVLYRSAISDLRIRIRFTTDLLMACPLNGWTWVLWSVLWAAMLERILTVHFVKMEMWINKTAVSVRPVKHYKNICFTSKTDESFPYTTVIWKCWHMHACSKGDILSIEKPKSSLVLDRTFIVTCRLTQRSNDSNYGTKNLHWQLRRTPTPHRMFLCVDVFRVSVSSAHSVERH